LPLLLPVVDGTDEDYDDDGDDDGDSLDPVNRGLLAPVWAIRGVDDPGRRADVLVDTERKGDDGCDGKEDLQDQQGLCRR
jgi:hypothetical protein